MKIDSRNFVLRGSGIRSGGIRGSYIRGVSEERKDAAAEFLGFKTVAGGVEGAANDPELLGAAGGGVNHFGVAAGKRDVFFITNQENGKSAGHDGFHWRDFRERKTSQSFSTIEKRPTKRSEERFSEPGIFSQAGVIVGRFTHIGERGFGDDGFDARVGSRGLQDDSRAHGFAKGENVSWQSSR
jgi:hypothetical protein